MKTKLLLICVAVAVLVTSCTSIDGHLSENTEKRMDLWQIENISQRNFLIAVDSISQSYEDSETRVSMKDVSNKSKWVLTNVIADGIGGCIGSGVFSWITGAAASLAYDKYLGWCERQMSRASSVPTLNTKNVELDEKYNTINDSIKLIFCGNNPKTSEDSIGLMHNKILNEARLSSNDYIIGNSIDYNQIFEDVKNSAVKSGVCERIDSFDLDKVKLFAFYDKMNGILLERLEGKKSNEIAYNELEKSLGTMLGQDKAKFMTVLTKSVYSCLGQDIELETLLSYSKNIDSVLKEANLSEDDMNSCKKLLQTMVSSYTYWKSYMEMNN